MQRTFFIGVLLVGGGLILGVPQSVRGQTRDSTVAVDTAVHVHFDAFVDGYYAWDFGNPPTFDRSFAGGALFTTQPARLNEFNINLAFVGATLAGPRVHGRLALQAGTSVQSNYAGEPANGQVSGPSLARNIQEAFVGIQLSDHVWIDGGIFFSHMGMESWISRDNPTYTRSLVAEYSPYYSSGIRAIWTATPSLTAQLDVVNGWQNISENNTGKGVGIRLEYAVNHATLVSYYNFFSDEDGNRLRTLNGIGARTTLGPAMLLGQADLGTQKHTASDGATALWYGFTAIASVKVVSSVSLAGRLERYADPDHVIIATGQWTQGTVVHLNGPFVGDGASVGVDVIPVPLVLWRTEVRGVFNHTAIFPEGASGAPSKRNVVIVSSLGLTF